MGDRTSNQCLNRWEKSLNPSIKRGKWSQKEDEVDYISVQIIVEFFSVKLSGLAC